ncbi:MAG TPA: RsmG family class I SAM-dependent methyltransferase, partial [Ktedonobacteraceae bacterium]|nr:RsmG family class I SAM-dependent methyltransferase [Ktedonobacteraceae bacterium]
ARPQWKIVLLEATGKKVAFQQHMIEVLGLQGIEAVQGRAEELAHQAIYRASFDLVTARAVAALPVLLEYTAPFCHLGGRVLLPKKGDLSEEIAQSRKAGNQVGLKLKGDFPVRLAGLDDGRRILAWEQVRLCPPLYPRASAAIKKKPLG